MPILRRDTVLHIAGLFLFISALAYSPGVFAAPTASLYLSPSSGTHSVGETFSLTVRVNTGGTAINAAEGNIVFDPSKLEVHSLSKAGSLFTLWTTAPAFSNAEGSIVFGGGLLTPGYSGSNGLILTINFRAKAATSTVTQITFSSGTVLANDGAGTNVLQGLGRSSMTITPASAQPTSTPPPKESTTELAWQKIQQWLAIHAYELLTALMSIILLIILLIFFLRRRYAHT